MIGKKRTGLLSRSPNILRDESNRVPRKPEILGGKLSARRSNLRLLRERIITYVTEVSSEANDVD